MRNLLCNVVAMFRNWRVVVLHVVVNAVLMVAASLWLLIPEEHMWQLIFAAVSALGIAFVALWLHSGTFVYATHADPTNFRGAFSIKTGRMLWLLLGVVVLVWCMNTVDNWNDHRWQLGGYLYSKAPSFLRPTGGEGGYINAIEYFYLVIFWFILPAVFLPATAAKIAGLRPRTALRAYASWRYWISMAAAAIVGVWITSEILDWIPGKTLHAQTVSLVLRMIVVYLLATVAWLAAMGIVGYFVESASAGSASSPAPHLVGEPVS